MASLTVEGIPHGLLTRLAKTAVANGRCVNSEVILSLVRHLLEDERPNCPAGPGSALCPFRTWARPGGRPEASVPWGDPG